MDAADASRTVTLRLTAIHNLFQTHEIDPFLGDNIEESGIDQLLDALKARRRVASHVDRIVIRLPERAIEPDLVAKVRAALIAYCNAQIRLCEQKKREIHLQAERTLPIGFLFLGVSIALSVASEALLGSSAGLGRVLSEGFIVVGWVGLWRPAELLLYEWRPYARDIRLYEQIKAMEVDIQPV